MQLKETPELMLAIANELLEDDQPIVDLLETKEKFNKKESVEDDDTSNQRTVASDPKDR